MFFYLFIVPFPKPIIRTKMHWKKRKIFKVKARFLHFGKVNFFLLSELKRKESVGFYNDETLWCIFATRAPSPKKEAFRIGTWLRLFMALSLEKSAVKVFSRLENPDSRLDKKGSHGGWKSNLVLFELFVINLSRLFTFSAVW